MRNFPIKLRVQLSIASNLPSSEMAIVSSSSVVNFNVSSLSHTTSSILPCIPLDNYPLHIAKGGSTRTSTRGRAPREGEFLLKKRLYIRFFKLSYLYLLFKNILTSVKVFFFFFFTAKIMHFTFNFYIMRYIFVNDVMCG